MGISKLRNRSRTASQGKADSDREQYGLGSENNYLFYGEGNGKSTLSIAKLEDEFPTLVISAAGGSAYMSHDNPHAVFITVSDISEARSVADELISNYKLLRVIQNLLSQGDEVLKNFMEQGFLPKYYPNDTEEGKKDFEYLVSLAKQNRFIYRRVVLEEINIISHWIQKEVEGIFDSEVLGEEKSLRGKDWSKLSSEITSFYAKFLSLPAETILATTDKKPGERKDLKEVIPEICQGGAQRLLISMIGNVFYVHNDAHGYYIKVKSSDEALVRSKFYKIGTDLELVPEDLDVTNHPEKFWQFVKDCREGKYNKGLLPEE